MNVSSLLPRQEQGIKKDYSYNKEFPTSESAQEAFRKARYRLLDINNWYEYSGDTMAVFLIMNTSGEPLSRRASIGDYIQIKLPMGTSPINKDDWVRVKDVRYESTDSDNEFLFLQLSPADSPLDDEGSTDHFFDEQSSSNFILKRDGRSLTISYHGRNEKYNISSPELGENIRNVIVSFGAFMLFSGAQWKNLIKGIIAEKRGGDIF